MAGFGSKHNYGSKAPTKKSGPKEDVVIVVNNNQIVQALIPFRTPRAPEIREVIKEKVLTDAKQRIFFYTADGWTNVDLDSTSSNPLITAEPAIAVERALKELKKCPAVGKVSIKDENERDITPEQVATLPFVALTDSATEEEDDGDQNDQPHDDTDDELADTVLELQAKGARAENEILALQGAVSELKDMLGQAISSYQRLDIQHAQLEHKINDLIVGSERGEAWAPPPPASHDDCEVVETPPPPRAPAKKLGRLQKARERAAAAAGADSSSAPTPAAAVDEEDVPLSQRAPARRRVPSKKRRLGDE